MTDSRWRLESYTGRGPDASRTSRLRAKTFVEGGDGLDCVVEIDGVGEAEVGEQAQREAGAGHGVLELGVLDLGGLQHDRADVVGHGGVRSSAKRNGTRVVDGDQRQRVVRLPRLEVSIGPVG